MSKFLDSSGPDAARIQPEARQAYFAARRAGRIDQSLDILSEEELEASFLTPSTAGDDDSIPQPEIIGYRIEKEISRGGQATVFNAIQEATGRRVAIKVLSTRVSHSARHRALYFREVRSLAAIQHPHVVGILDCGRTESGHFFLVMDYVDGWTLDEYFARQLQRGADGIRDALHVMAKLAKAVDVVHQHGIVHRDLKPSNVRVDIHGEPRLLDFGLVKEIGEGSLCESTSVAGGIVGSLPWSSPEQVGSGEPITARSDIYAMGVILYRFFAGELPYAIGSIGTAVHNILNARVREPTTCAGALRLRNGSSVNYVILKCLRRDPARRYANCLELSEDLALLANGVHLRGRYRFRPWAAAACGMVFAVAAGACCFWGREPGPPVVFELPSYTNSIELTLVRIPAGPMSREGSTLKVQSFFISTTEVTQSQFERVLQRNPTRLQQRGADLPVVNVSMKDAREFCKALSKLENRTYRLPTRDEWEYACRAERNSITPGESALGKVAWYAENSQGALHPVRRKFPNRWGLYDMLGNASELTDSGLEDGSLAFGLGGSFLGPASSCSPTAVTVGECRMDVGFRIAMDIPR